jgi:ribosomal protein S18 acetylase RimI-like enzyme
VNLRAGVPNDRRLIVPTWAQSFVSPWSRKLTARHHSRLVDALLDRPRVRVVVAYASVPEAIQAWACGEQSTLHYVYVPPELRGHGIARRLIRECLGEYPEHGDATHPWPCREHGRCTDIACPKRGARWRFNPYPTMEQAAA